jgi:hypothetical protein
VRSSPATSTSCSHESLTTLLVNELDTAQWCLDEGDTSSSYAIGLFRDCHWLADRWAALR